MLARYHVIKKEGKEETVSGTGQLKGRRGGWISTFFDKEKNLES